MVKLVGDSAPKQEALKGAGEGVELTASNIVAVGYPVATAGERVVRETQVVGAHYIERLWQPLHEASSNLAAAYGVTNRVGNESCGIQGEMAVVIGITAGSKKKAVMIEEGADFIARSVDAGPQIDGVGPFTAIVAGIPKVEAPPIPVLTRRRENHQRTIVGEGRMIDAHSLIEESTVHFHLRDFLFPVVSHRTAIEIGAAFLVEGGVIQVARGGVTNHIVDVLVKLDKNSVGLELKVER